MQPYLKFPLSGGDLPITNRLAAELLTLPTGTGVSTEDIHIIAARIRMALKHAARVRRELGERRNVTAALPDQP
jgi:dTDP-4-amino-4,6-dideoxygalactose transaminase